MKRDDFDPTKEFEEEYAHRIQREVQHVEREEEGEDDEYEGYDEDEEDEEEEDDIEQSEEGEEESEEDEEDDEEDHSTERVRSGLLWLMISGNVLLSRSITKYYGQMAIVATLFLLSIVVMFGSLHLDMQYNALTRNVQLLRERSVRLQEVRSSRTSHSAVVAELERRNIEIADPTTPATVIVKEESFIDRFR